MAGALLAVLVAISALGQVYAETSSSTNFKIDQTQFGSGSSQRSCSESFCSKASLGDTTVGSSSSANYIARFGAVTEGEPVLEIITLGDIENVGVLDVDRTATSSAVVKVRSYLSSGYVMQIAGPSPNQGTHELARMQTPSTSHQGAEQFGINLVANDAPQVGSDPEQVPDNTTSFGYVTDDYSTPNLFKYSSGDPVARSDTSSGQTNYTISMIVNVSNTTPGGRYSGQFSAIVVPTY